MNDSVLTTVVVLIVFLTFLLRPLLEAEFFLTFPAD